ncbi:sub-family E member 1 [Seminavis robusta]|uniref:Sub-family E member 1 n=1 Tax=Seminavis robusta TaxID=568900 RepID=A0A9N8ETG5_9STRA|nr:sub-family E member 1 [Seminavis robusta]|eukprot:Sro1647_g288370.1 sub-family E member 1 (665) ;mRNA; r:8494-10988
MRQFRQQLITVFEEMLSEEGGPGITVVVKGKSTVTRGSKAAKEEAKRIVVIDPDKVKPNSEAFHYLKRNAGGCGKPCIQIGSDKKVTVAEDACPVCVNRCKQCPGDAVSVVKLPTNLTTNTTHRYGPNSFKLHGLPVPRPGHVLGLLGSNGTGKSTCLDILSGKLKPNLGNIDDNPPDWASIITHYRGSDLQKYFQGIVQDNLTVAVKPQLETGLVKRLQGKQVRALLEARDERGRMDEYVKELELEHLMDRQVEELSGGELQRFATACVLGRDASVYMFDEVTSFLDIKQRLKVSKLIRALVHESPEKYVIVVEHDLAILDAMSDYVQCLYGSPGAYGVVTGRSRVRNGINQFLAGYIPADNMRFRDHELTFKVASSDLLPEREEGVALEAADSPKTGIFEYPAMSYTRGEEAGFTLHVEAGALREGECVVLMGENGTGKTTFMEMLAGNLQDQSTDSLASFGVSYKRQGLYPKLRRFQGNVRALLETKINAALSDRLFRLLVLKPLSMDRIQDLPVASLSGGEMQRLAITLCLGQPAQFYLIDEPSAGLDCEQRVNAAKVMKRWVVNHLGKTLLLVEHDFVMASAMADRVVVYEGNPGVECTARAPTGVAESFNRFLKILDVTFRRDPTNFRPRVNKKGSRIDKEQRANGDYYKLVTEEEEA